MQKNMVFHFEGGRHAALPQKPVVKWVEQKQKQSYAHPILIARTTTILGHPYIEGLTQTQHK